MPLVLCEYRGNISGPPIQGSYLGWRSEFRIVQILYTRLRNSLLQQTLRKTGFPANRILADIHQEIDTV